MAEAREVSTRVTRMLLEYAEALPGVAPPPEPIRGVLRSASDWTSWARYLSLLERLGVGESAEEQRAFGSGFMDHAAHTPFRHVGALTGGSQALFQATYGWVLGAHIRVLRSEVELLGPGALQVRLVLDPEQPAGTAFFHSAAGTMERLPVLLGQGAATVDARVGSHEATFDVQLSPSTALGARMRRAMRVLTDTEDMDLSMAHLRESMLMNLASVRESNARLRESEERWRALIGAMPGVIAMVDREGRIESLLGARVADEAAIGTPLLALAPEGERPHLAGLLERVLAGETVEDTARVLGPDGSVSHWAFRAAPMPAEGRVVVVGVDVTEGHHAQEALRQSEQRLAQAQKMEVVARLAGGLAHDVNNVLAAVRGHAELLELARPEDAAVQRAADGILHAVERVSRLTRQLLAYGTEMPLEPRWIDLGAMVAEAQGLLERVVGENVDFAVHAPAEPVVARVDPAQLEQVLLNLVLNARDALPEGGKVVVRLWADGDRALLEVVDDGVGMEPGVLAHALEPFFSTKEAGRGSGLGLYTVHGLLLRSGGGLELESEPGVGTTARAWLPRGTNAEATPAPASRLKPAARSGRVLLVEDDRDVRELLGEMLDALGYGVISCEDGREALALVEAGEQVDLLVSDMVMPGPSGLEVARQAVARIPTLPVLLISGFTDQDPTEAEAFAVRSRFLRKPFGMEALARALDELGA